MGKNKKITFPFEVCATQSLMAQSIALNELQGIKTALDKVNEKRLTKCHNFRHGVKLTINGLECRISNLYQKNVRHSKNAAKDIATVKKLLSEITKDMQPEVDRLKRCIFKYVSFNDCIYEELIAIFLTVGTLLHHAVEVFDFVDNPYKYIQEGFDVYRTRDRIRPEAEYRHFIEAVSATKIMPDDLNYMEDMDVANCITIMADKLGKLFVDKFTQPLPVL